MELKDILVHVDASDGCAERVGLSIDLAIRHGAHLTGLYLMPIPAIPDGYGMVPSAGVVEALLDAAAAREKRAQAAFLNTAQQRGIAVEWRSESDPIIAGMDRQCRLVDIVCIGGSGAEAGSPGGGFAEHVILGSGRPVLIVPEAGVGQTVAENVAIAWNGSAEAARAVSDSMPLLSAASSVKLVIADRGASGKATVSDSEVITYLSRHGVKATTQRLSLQGLADAMLGDAIVDYAVEEAVDLIVMGAYGHSRWSELLLGGMTRQLIRHSRVPVLLSH